MTISTFIINSKTSIKKGQLIVLDKNGNLVPADSSESYIEIEKLTEKEYLDYVLNID